jgi:hypothetical protein
MRDPCPNAHDRRTVCPGYHVGEDDEIVWHAGDEYIQDDLFGEVSEWVTWE